MTALQHATYQAVLKLSEKEGSARLVDVRAEVRKLVAAGDLSIGATLFYLKRGGYIVRTGLGRYAPKDKAPEGLF